MSTLWPLEPTMKKKRKHADAHQLEVLKATYNSTAFPSTEERAALAKRLDLFVQCANLVGPLFFRHLSY
jgi:homeobox protein YOX1/YHP1